MKLRYFRRSWYFLSVIKICWPAVLKYFLCLRDFYFSGRRRRSCSQGLRLHCSVWRDRRRPCPNHEWSFVSGSEPPQHRSTSSIFTTMVHNFLRQGVMGLQPSCSRGLAPRLVDPEGRVFGWGYEGYYWGLVTLLETPCCCCTPAEAGHRGGGCSEDTHFSGGTLFTPSTTNLSAPPYTFNTSSTRIKTYGIVEVGREG